ncbi:hypothetical protein KSD_49200 [Ktedonobacter sp. SOSP1-85]|uniref:tetratricopeptide repeat protein n=1 Tax=Ktedonobacter sp. SOSP1-85 TaxID=2778367 RepID=UPI0019166DB7|nr:tetratricopeptide repeat protein [Ktedonobacter sp. SOSP1-85]GHO77149.1 hypothetical protein KSD_49200 [Ktedonobacter sp. SOSP1-85]
MEPSEQQPVQRIEHAEKSAVSFSGQASVTNIEHYHATASIWTPPLMLPPRAPSFVGREENLSWLLQQLHGEGGMTLALCGPGGIGKTALVAEALARLVAQEDWLTRFPGGIFYHSFYASPTLVEAFEQLARLCGEELGSDPRLAAVRAVSRRRTLLIFDGVEMLDDARPLHEFGGTSVVLLISWRHSDAPDLAHCHTLYELSAEESITLLQKLGGLRATNQQCIQRLFKHVGGYPLAFRLIGGYLFSHQEEIADYLDWFEQEGLMAMHHGKHRMQSVLVLLQRTYDALTSNEQGIFLLLGLLAPAPFPLELVQGILELPERAIRMALGTLVDLSVLRRSDQDYEVSHPLIHTFAKELVSSQMKVPLSSSPDTITVWQDKLWKQRVVLAVNDVCPDVDNIAQWESCEHWLSHALLCATWIKQEQMLFPEAAHLLHQAGSYLRERGRYVTIEPLLDHALTIYEQLTDLDQICIAKTLTLLALVYENQARYADAERLLNRALTIYEQTLGAKHPVTVKFRVEQFSTLYLYQGRYADAELLLQSGEHDEDRLNNLASLYSHRQRYSDAERLFKQALEICEQQFGPNHYHLFPLLHNLAVTLFKQRKYIDATLLSKRALSICKQALGEEHPQTQKAREDFNTIVETAKFALSCIIAPFPFPVSLYDDLWDENGVCSWLETLH